MFSLHRIISLPCSIFMGGTAVARGVMTPFCLIINSRRRLLPRIPVNTARQWGCAGWGAQHEAGSKEKDNFSFTCSFMLCSDLPYFAVLGFLHQQRLNGCSRFIPTCQAPSQQHFEPHTPYTHRFPETADTVVYFFWVVKTTSKSKCS